MNTIATDLRAALDLLEDGRAWHQGCAFRDRAGRPTRGEADGYEPAASYSLDAAVGVAAPTPQRASHVRAALIMLAGTRWRHLTDWNDQPGRTWAEVRDLVRATVRHYERAA